MSLLSIIKDFESLIANAQSMRPKGWSFKVRNYRKVIDLIRVLPERAWTTGELLGVLREGGMKLSGEKPDGPYKSQILIKIEKILTNGSLGIEVDDKSKVVKELMRIPEVGPSKAGQLYAKGARSLKDVELHPEWVNRKQLIGMRYLSDLEQRIPRSEMDIWKSILGESVVEGVDVELAGSYRRGKKDSGDIDLYVSVSGGYQGLMENIKEKLIEGGYMKSEDIISCGERKMMGVVGLLDKPKRHLDVFIYPKAEYAFALLFATGSGQFNVRMREYALKKGYSLSDKGLRKGSASGEWVTLAEYRDKIGVETIRKEREIFDFLGLNYIEPGDRSAQTEF